MKKNSTLPGLDMARLGEALDRERRRRHMTWPELAQLLGIDTATPRQWRRGGGMNGVIALRISLFIDADLRRFTVPPALPATRDAA
jgi:hypothetical protein